MSNQSVEQQQSPEPQIAPNPERYIVKVQLFPMSNTFSLVVLQNQLMQRMLQDIFAPLMQKLNSVEQTVYSL